jgi:predicted DNA-binding transcriptional regulator AlpA
MPDDQDLLTVQEAVERLGVSRATFYNYAQRLERFRRVGDRRVLYRAADIDAMAKVQPVQREAATEPPVVYKPRRRASRQKRAKD